MRTVWEGLILAFAIIAVGTAEGRQLDSPKPEVYARAEDQERARLMNTPCSEADVNQRCYRWYGSIIPWPPCAYAKDADTMAFLPVDACYKMDEPRRYRGMWVDQFEGQTFTPEGAERIEWPRMGADQPGWREQFDRARAAGIWLDVSRVKLKHQFRTDGRKVLIDFIGRKTLHPGNYGHMGLWGNEIIVDRVISAKEVR